MGTVTLVRLIISDYPGYGDLWIVFDTHSAECVYYTCYLWENVL